jgi:hypothetical protein
LDVVRIEVLQLKTVLVEDPPDEPPDGDGEAALVESHERDDVPLGQAWHGLLPGHLSLHGGGEWRELSGIDKAVQHLEGHVGPRPFQHDGGKLSNELAVRAVTVLRVQGRKESKMQERRKMIRE